MRKLSKTLSLILAAIMAVSVLWIPVSAEETITVTVSFDKDTYAATITWTPVSGAKTYLVDLLQENTDGNFYAWNFTQSVGASEERSWTVPGSWFCDPGLDNWEARITARNAVGGTIGHGFSDVFHSGMPTLTAPEPILDASGMASWNQVEDANQYFYKLYGREPGDDGNGTYIVGGTEPQSGTQIVTDLSCDMEDGFAYRYSVYAYDNKYGHRDSDTVYSEWIEYKPAEPEDKAHNVTVSGGYAASDTGGNNVIGKAMPGDTVYIYPIAPAGKTFEGWTISPSSLSLEETKPYHFTMPATDVNISAVLRDSDAIDSVKVLGELSTGTSLEGLLKTEDEKIAGVEKVMWNYNGSVLTAPGTPAPGSYQALVLLRAAKGYRFSKDTEVEIFGKKASVVSISDDGMTASYFSQSVSLSCDHSKDVSAWNAQPGEHFRVCSVCGQTYNKESHVFGTGVTVAGTTTYTCTVCDYKKKTSADKECIDWIIVNAPPLTIGSALPEIRLDDFYKDKMSIVGNIVWVSSAENISADSVAESGKTYTLIVTFRAKEGFYFSEDVGVRLGTANTVLAEPDHSDESLTVAVDMPAPVPAAEATVVLPELTVGKTMEDILDEIGESIITDEKYYYGIDVRIENNGTVNSYYTNIYREGWSADSISTPYDTFKAQTVQPGSVYIFRIQLQIAGGSNTAYIDEKSVTVTNKTAADSVAVSTDSTGVSVTAVYCTEGDGKTMPIAVVNVDKPETGAAPATKAESVGHFTASAPAWSPAPETFAYDTAYTVSVTLTPEEGYSFDENAVAYVNGNAAGIKKDGNRRIVTFTFPKTGKIPQTVTFEKTSVSALTGTTVTNTASSSANMKITYSVVSGSDIVHIDTASGTVYADKPGTAVIRAVAAAGGDYSAAEATYQLTVTGTQISSIELTVPEAIAGKQSSATKIPANLTANPEDSVTASNILWLILNDGKPTHTYTGAFVKDTDYCYMVYLYQNEGYYLASDGENYTGELKVNGGEVISAETDSSGILLFVKVKSTVQTFDVSFEMNGHGSAPAAQKVESGMSVTSPAAPKADGYTFGGWYKDAACKTAFDFNAAITANTTVYAKWTKKTEPVTPTEPEKPDFMYGDVDGDKKVSAADARLALRKSVGLEKFAEGSDAFIAADVDFDGKVSAADARLILRASVGLEDPKTWKKA